MTTNTKKILLESRDEIASFFNDRYGANKIEFFKTKYPPFSQPRYWLTGFNITYKGISRFIEVRMQIKEDYDEKRRIHFARFIENPQQNYFIEKLAFDVEEKGFLSNDDDHVSGRHPYLMRHKFDFFSMPNQGFGIITNFDNPSKTGENLFAIDSIINATLKKPCKDAFILSLIAKLPDSYGEYK